MHANEPITKDDSVICTDAYSKVSFVKIPLTKLIWIFHPNADQVLPLEGGEIFVALTTGRPSAANIQESEVGLHSKINMQMFVMLLLS